MAELYYSTLVSMEKTGNLAADAVEHSAVSNFGLNEGFVAAVVEMIPPRNAGGDIENYIPTLIIDGEEYGFFHPDSRMLPAYGARSKSIALLLGDPKSTSPVDNTCLKGNKSIQIKGTGGVGDVTGNRFVRVKGYYLFEDAAVVQLLQGATMFNPSPAGVYDAIRDKVLVIHRSTPATIAGLSEMSGGAPRAEKPRVLPLIRHAWNLANTTVNTDYRFKDEGVYIGHAWEKLSWNLDADEGLYITHLGVVTHDNAKELAVIVAGKDFPRNRWNIKPETNELPIGSPDDFQGPRSLQRKLVCRGELVELVIKDNGTLIPAATGAAGTGIMPAVWAKLFEGVR